MENLSHRKATQNDLPAIVRLLLEDALGKTRERWNDIIDPKYTKAFEQINSDPNQYLMVVEKGNVLVGTCHLTIMPSLTFTGSTRMQIEAVRVAENYRGQKIGEWMMAKAFDYAVSKDVGIIQLTTNAQRPRAKVFYERLEFKATHIGMKYYIHES
jgi:ribosomal protein S18 acetylase RimI-like enzyme